MIFWSCSFYLQHQVQEEKCWSFKLTNSLILAQLLMPLALGAWVVLEEKHHVDISESIESSFLIHPARST